MSRAMGLLEEFLRRGQAAQRSADEALLAEKINRALMKRGGKAMFRAVGVTPGRRAARFDILAITDELTIIRDVGPWSEHPTITNDAENVVDIIAGCWLRPGARLFYFDSSGQLDELLVKDCRFVGFAPGPR